MQFQLSVQTTVLMNEIPTPANTQYTRKSRALVLSLQAGHYTGNSNLSVILFGILGSYLFLHIWENIILKLGKKELKYMKLGK